jgi:hypothetical protein
MLTINSYEKKIKIKVTGGGGPDMPGGGGYHTSLIILFL